MYECWELFEILYLSTLALKFILNFSSMITSLKNIWTFDRFLEIRNFHHSNPFQSSYKIFKKFQEILKISRKCQKMF